MSEGAGAFYANTTRRNDGGSGTYPRYSLMYTERAATPVGAPVDEDSIFGFLSATSSSGTDAKFIAGILSGSLPSDEWTTDLANMSAGMVIKADRVTVKPGIVLDPIAQGSAPAVAGSLIYNTSTGELNYHDSSGWNILTTGSGMTAHDLTGAFHTEDATGGAGNFLKADTATTFSWQAHGLVASDVGAYTTAQVDSAIDADIATHAALLNVHHTRYADSEAVSAVEAVTLDMTQTPVIRTPFGKTLWRMDDTFDEDLIRHGWTSPLGNFLTFRPSPAAGASPRRYYFSSSIGFVIETSADARVFQVDYDGNIIMESTKTVDGVDVGAEPARISTEIDTDIATHAGIATAHQDAPGLIATHAAISSAHHIQYTDTMTEAVIIAELVDGQSIDNAIDSLISTHAGLPNVHHSQSHDLTGADHTDSGLTIGHFLKATGTTTFAWGAHGLSASDVGAAPAFTKTQWTLPVFDTTTTIGDSMVSQNSGGTLLTVGGDLKIEDDLYISQINAVFRVISSVTNKPTSIRVHPTGTVDATTISVCNAADTINTGMAHLMIDGTIAYIGSFGAGTGTAPTTLNINDSDWGIINIGDAGCTVTLGDLNVITLPAGVADYNKFLVSDGGEIKFRTGAEVASDIGAAVTGEPHVLATTGPHTGTLPWTDLSKTGSSLADLATRTHASLSDAPTSAHHVRYADSEAVSAVQAANPLTLTNHLVVSGASTSTFAGKVQINETGAGPYLSLGTVGDTTDPMELLKFNTERAWSFRKRSTGASTRFALESDIGSKYFWIGYDDGVIYAAKFFVDPVQANCTVQLAHNVTVDGDLTVNGGDATLNNTYITATLANIKQAQNWPLEVTAASYSNSDYHPLIAGFTTSSNPTKPKVGIFARYNSLGSQLFFSTSNSYSTGLVHHGYIDETGNWYFQGNLTLAGGNIISSLGNNAITIDSSGNVTKVGQDTPSTNQYLQWDGSKVIWTSIGAGGPGAGTPWDLPVWNATGSALTDSMVSQNSAGTICTIGGSVVLGAGATVGDIDTVMAASPTDAQLLTAQGIQEYVNKHNNIGSGNADWINCPYEGATNEETDEMKFSGAVQPSALIAGTRFIFSVPLPTTRGGKSLYINGTRVSLSDADSNDRVTPTYIYGMGNTTATELDNDPTDKNAIGLWEDLSMGALNLGGYDAAKIALTTYTGTLGDLEIQYVTVRFYYA